MENKDVYKKLHRITKLYLQTLGDETKQILNDTKDFKKVIEYHNVIITTLDNMYSDEDCIQLGKLTDGRMSILRAFYEEESIKNIHNLIIDIINSHDNFNDPAPAALVSFYNIIDTIYQFMNTYLIMFQIKGLITDKEEHKLHHLLDEYNDEIEDKTPVFLFDQTEKTDSEFIKEKGK